MSAPVWTFILSDIQGVILGEVTNANNRQVVLPLNRVPTASFQVPLNHYLSSYLTDPTWAGLLKCYRNGTLVFHGEVVSSSEQSDPALGQTVAVNAAGALWRLQYKLLGINSAGWALGNATTTYDLGYIAQQMIIGANTIGYTGVGNGTTVASSNGSAGLYYFKPVLTAIAEIATGLNSFDFEVAPTEPTNVGQSWPQIGLFNAQPLIGTKKTNAVFEYGTSKANVGSYGRSITRDGQMNIAYIEQPAVSDHSGILISADLTSVAARGAFQGVVDNGGVEWDVLRQALADANVKYRKVPREIINFQPVMNSSPQPFTDYIVGDQVRCRITVDGLNRLDAFFRVWGITFNMNQSGDEAPTLELLMP